jgi:hypothetical protein
LKDVTDVGASFFFGDTRKNEVIVSWNKIGRGWWSIFFRGAIEENESIFSN